jgi:hypothetical protein
LSDSGTIPEYLPGDVATVEFMVKHETNIEELGAWFTRQLEEEDEGEPEIFFLGQTEVVSREGAQILSQAVLHQTITHQYLPGEYRLRAMTTFSEGGSRNRRIRDVPDIRLRVLPEPKTVPEVVRWEVY